MTFPTHPLLRFLKILDAFFLFLPPFLAAAFLLSRCVRLPWEESSQKFIHFIKPWPPPPHAGLSPFSWRDHRGEKEKEEEEA